MGTVKGWGEESQGCRHELALLAESCCVGNGQHQVGGCTLRWKTALGVCGCAYNQNTSPLQVTGEPLV